MVEDFVEVGLSIDEFELVVAFVVDEFADAVFAFENGASQVVDAFQVFGT